MEASLINTPPSAAKMWFKAVRSFNSPDLGGHIEPGTIIGVAEHQALVEHLLARGFLKPTLPHAGEVDWNALVNRARALQQAAIQELLNPVPQESNTVPMPVPTELEHGDRSDDASEPNPSAHASLAESPATERKGGSAVRPQGDHVRGGGRGDHIVPPYTSDRQSRGRRIAVWIACIAVYVAGFLFLIWYS